MKWRDRGNTDSAEILAQKDMCVYCMYSTYSSMYCTYLGSISLLADSLYNLEAGKLKSRSVSKE